MIVDKPIYNWEKDCLSYRIRFALSVLEWWESLPEHKRANFVSNFEKSLDYARAGSIDASFKCMDMNSNIGRKFNRKIVGFEYNSEQFFIDMNKLADDLEKEGY